MGYLYPIPSDKAYTFNLLPGCSTFTQPVTYYKCISNISIPKEFLSKKPSYFWKNIFIIIFYIVWIVFWYLLSKGI